MEFTYQLEEAEQGIQACQVLLRQIREGQDRVKDNLYDRDLEYMKSRVENLIKIIPDVFSEDEKSILYIF